MVSAPVLCEPDVALAPFQPPEAVHDVVLVELHVRVDEPPEVIEVGEAVKVTVGMGTLEPPSVTFTRLRFEVFQSPKGFTK